MNSKFLVIIVWSKIYKISSLCKGTGTLCTTHLSNLSELQIGCVAEKGFGGVTDEKGFYGFILHIIKGNFGEYSCCVLWCKG